MGRVLGALALFFAGLACGHVVAADEFLDAIAAASLSPVPLCSSGPAPLEPSRVQLVVSPWSGLANRFVRWPHSPFHPYPVD